MRFLHLNFLNARGILAPKIYIMHTLFFINFMTLKVRVDPKGQASSVNWFPVSLNAPELAVLRKANLILICISLSSAK